MGSSSVQSQSGLLGWVSLTTGTLVMGRHKRRDLSHQVPNLNLSYLLNIVYLPALPSRKNPVCIRK